MQLTQEGMEMFIKKCEENGDFSASKIKIKEEVAEALLKNDIVKTERALERIENEVKSTEEQIAQKSIPQNNNLKKLLPILAIGGIIYLIIKKDTI